VVRKSNRRMTKKAAAWEKKARKALATIALALSAAEKENIIECTIPKAAWEVLEKLYEGKGRNRKFMLLQELFRMSMSDWGKMDRYLRGVREKMSELSTIGLKLEDDIKLAIILNGLPDRYRYLVVSLEKEETIDFDELMAKILEEEVKVEPQESEGPTAMLSKRNLGGPRVCQGISNGIVRGSVVTTTRLVTMRVNAGSNTRS
jgi:gag-polypeptide of LTR copia-type